MKKAKIVQVHVKYLFGRNVVHCKLVAEEDLTEILIVDAMSRVLTFAQTNEIEIVNAQAALTELVVKYGCGA